MNNFLAVDAKKMNMLDADGVLWFLQARRDQLIEPRKK